MWRPSGRSLDISQRHLHIYNPPLLVLPLRYLSPAECAKRFNPATSSGATVSDECDESFSSNLESPGPPRIPPGALGRRRLGTPNRPKFHQMGSQQLSNALRCGLSTSYPACDASEPFLAPIFFNFDASSSLKIGHFH